MTSQYQILWTDTAAKDLKNILAYIAEESPQNAVSVYQKIKEKASNLSALPERGRIVPELQEQGISQYRELVILSWRLIYRIAENKIYILSVIDSRRNVEDILLNRLIQE